MNNIPKRSNEPIFWGLFGAGGMWSAIVSPMIIVLVALIAPLMGSESIIATFFQDSILLKLAILFTIILPFWCSVHRVHHTLHDLKVHVPAGGLLFYGAAVIVTVIALIGFF